MAGTDGHAKEYFSNPVNAADLFTNTLFQRLFRVDPSMLTRMDPTEVQTDVLMAGGPEVVALQRYDDVLYQLNLPKGGLLSSDESRRLSELAKLLCKAMEEPEEADQTCEDGDQSSIEEKQDSADRRQISGDAGEVPESAEPGTDAGQDHEAAEGSASGQEKIDFEDLFSDSKNLFRELACMILPFLLMFLPEAMEREFETIKPRKCKTALLKNVMSAMKKAIETAFLSALKEMARQLDQDISQMHIAIISLENMGQVRFDTVFRVMTRTSMRYNAQIEAARMKEFQNAVTQYNIRKENAKKRNMAFLEKQALSRNSDCSLSCSIH